MLEAALGVFVPLATMEKWVIFANNSMASPKNMGNLGEATRHCWKGNIDVLNYLFTILKENTGNSILISLTL